MAVHFHFENINIPLKNRNKLKEYIFQQFENEGLVLEHLGYIFCTDDYLLALNKDYLHHDTYTDILTFDLSENQKITAEIYISGERVKENAATFNTSFKEELHRVIFHGALHLCGYNDHSKQEKKAMRAKENDWLTRYFAAAGSENNTAS